MSLRPTPVSWCRVSTAASDKTRCVSTPGMATSNCSSRKPYTAPVAPVMATTIRRGRCCWLSGIEQGLQFARFKHFIHDIGTTDELAFDIQLRNGWPVRVILDALAHFRVIQHVNGSDVFNAACFQDMDG